MTDTSPPCAKEGQSIRESGNHVVVMQTVKAACDNKENGHWFCGTHDEHFLNNMQWWNHIDADPLSHLGVWVCHDHGLEVP